MAVDIFTVVLVGKLIEPLWGALEMMTFFFIINTGNVLLMLSDHGQYSLFITGVAVLCAIFYYLLYMITENVDLLFQVHKLSRTLAYHLFTKFPGAHSWSLWLPGWGEHCSEASYARPCACQVIRRQTIIFIG